MLHEMGRRIQVLTSETGFCLGKNGKLEVSCKALWDLWEHNQFKNWINLAAFIILSEHRKFPEANFLVGADFKRKLMQRKSKFYLAF